MGWKFFSMWIHTTGVSFVLIALLFSFMSMVTEEIGPTGPISMLILFVMCMLISVWTSFLRMKIWSRSWLFFLLAYAGCVGVVLGLGQATGFIPLDRIDQATFWLIVFMITAVYIGTAMFALMKEKNEAKKINAGLARMHAEDRKRSEGK